MPAMLAAFCRANRPGPGPLRCAHSPAFTGSTIPAPTMSTYVSFSAPASVTLARRQVANLLHQSSRPLPGTPDTPLVRVVWGVRGVRHASLITRVQGDLEGRFLQRTAHNRYPMLLVRPVVQTVQRSLSPQQSQSSRSATGPRAETAARNDSLLHNCPRSRQSVPVSVAVLLLLQLRLPSYVAAPTLMIATPPASFANRSCRFSLS